MFYGIPDVAKALGIGQTTAWALIRDGKLPACRLGRRTLVPAQALTDFATSLTSAKR
jgi:excisionase family DNA binding protein